MIREPWRHQCGCERRHLACGTRLRRHPPQARRPSPRGRRASGCSPRSLPRAHCRAQTGLNGGTDAAPTTRSRTALHASRAVTVTPLLDVPWVCRVPCTHAEERRCQTGRERARRMRLFRVVTRRKPEYAADGTADRHPLSDHPLLRVHPRLGAAAPGAHDAPKPSAAPCIARNRMRMRLPRGGGGALAASSPARRRCARVRGRWSPTQDGTPVMDYAARPRDRAYAAKLYLEYSMARILPEEIRRGNRPPSTATSRPCRCSVSDAAAAIIDAAVHDLGDDKKRRR